MNMQTPIPIQTQFLLDEIRRLRTFAAVAWIVAVLGIALAVITRAYSA